MPQDPVADRLRIAPVPEAIKASAWDAYESATDEDDLAKRLRALPLPDSVRADLWDLKASTASVPSAPMATPAPPERSWAASTRANTPSGASLAGTAVKTAARDIFVAPFELAGSLISNTAERFGRASAAFGRGEYGTALSETVQGLPPVAMTRAMIVDPARDQFAKAGAASREPLTASSLGRTVGHGVAGAVPLVGPMAAGLTEQALSGDPQQQAEALGHGVALLVGPKVLGKTASGLATVAGKGARSVSGGVRGAYQGYQEGGVGGGIVQGMGGAFRGVVDPLEPIPLITKALKPLRYNIRSRKKRCAPRQ